MIGRYYMICGLLFCMTMGVVTEVTYNSTKHRKSRYCLYIDGNKLGGLIYKMLNEHAI